MSKQIQVVIVTSPFQAPAGTVSGGINVSLQGAATPLSVQAIGPAGGPYAATLDVSSVAAGSYTLVAQAVDSTGKSLGAAVSAPVTLSSNAPPTTVSVDAPASMTVTVS